MPAASSSPAGAAASTGAGSILAPLPMSPPSAARVAHAVAAPFATQPGAGAGADATAGAGRRPNFQFDLSDIEKAHSISYVSRLHKDARCPLDPVYRLPAVAERPVTPPRFIRDAMVVSDIERARPRSAAGTHPARISSSLCVDDLPGARPLQRYGPRRTGAGGHRHSSSLSSRDITHTRPESTRHTNPLDPVYSFGRATNLDVSSLVGAINNQGHFLRDSQQNQGDVVSFGPVEGGKSREAPRPRQPENVLALRTDDISSPAAACWSWTKPARTQFRNTTATHDVPGAQVGADRGRLAKSNRHTDPNTRDYGSHALGARSGLSDNSGMVHVHRHVLDGSDFAAGWKAAQGEPAPDAAGVSMWRSGNFTAGSLAPRLPAAKAAAPAQAQPMQQQVAFAPAPAAAASPPVATKQAFGAPAEDSWMRESLSSTATAVAAAKPATPLLASASSARAADDSAPASSSAPTPAALAAAVASAAAPSALAPNYSYPPNTHKDPAQEKRHNPLHNRTANNLLANPPSNGRATLPVDAAARVRPMTFGVRGPFAVDSRAASIQDSQQASTLSATSTAAASRSSSRPGSRTQMQPGVGAGLDRPASSTSAHSQPQSQSEAARTRAMASFSPAASTLSNAFSLAFVPTSTMPLPRALPFSSPVSRPGLGTVELFERKGATPTPHAGEILARTQERRVAQARAQEILQVRALG